jgi:hypothetical protein
MPFTLPPIFRPPQSPPQDEGVTSEGTSLGPQSDKPPEGSSPSGGNRHSRARLRVALLHR